MFFETKNIYRSVLFWSPTAKADRITSWCTTLVSKSIKSSCGNVTSVMIHLYASENKYYYYYYYSVTLTITIRTIGNYVVLCDTMLIIISCSLNLMFTLCQCWSITGLSGITTICSPFLDTFRVLNDATYFLLALLKAL